jgi:hypothetical protein
MGFKITRQRYSNENNGQGQLAVEICSGTKHVGDDVLTTRYKDLGESKYLVNPVDAFNCAVRIINKWNLDYHDELKKVAIVNADGNGGKEYFDISSKRELQELEKLSKNILAKMSHCGSCHRPLGNSKKIFSTDDLPNHEFCDEVCGSRKYRDMYGVEMPKKKVAKVRV